MISVKAPARWAVHIIVVLFSIFQLFLISKFQFLLHICLNWLNHCFSVFTVIAAFDVKVFVITRLVFFYLFHVFFSNFTLFFTYWAYVLQWEVLGEVHDIHRRVIISWFSISLLFLLFNLLGSVKWNFSLFWKNMLARFSLSKYIHIWPYGLRR